MLASDSYRDPSAKGRKRPSCYDWSEIKINIFFSLSLEFVFSSIISRISNIHIHSDCHFTEQKLKVKKSNPSRSGRISVWWQRFSLLKKEITALEIGILCSNIHTLLGCWLPITLPYIIHSNLVNLNVKYLKNRHKRYPTCIHFSKISPRWIDLHNRNVACYARKNSARNETHHFWLLFHEFLQPDVYIPHPPITMNSLRKQISSLPKWYISLCSFYKK